MDTSIQELLDLEWQLFDASPQAGQRSARPEDREWFIVTRSSQLSTWTPALLESWQKDLQVAQAEGRNLVNEKYIYMLERTAPEQYDALKIALPKPSMEKLWLIDWICQAEIIWQEALVKKYPRLTRNSRAIRGDADCRDGVSFETFLRSELMTYSVYTLRLYARQIEHAQRDGRNLCENILENTIQQLGLKSLQQAESSI